MNTETMLQKAILSTILHWDLNVDSEKVGRFELDADYFDSIYKHIIKAITKFQKENIMPDFILVSHKLRDTMYQDALIDIGASTPLGSYDSLKLYYDELKKLSLHETLTDLRLWS